MEVNRSTIFNDALAIYSTKPYLANQFPILVEFEGEDGVDFGGVGRDFFQHFGTRPKSDFLMVLPFSHPCHMQMYKLMISLLLERFYHMVISVMVLFHHEFLFLFWRLFC